MGQATLGTRVRGRVIARITPLLFLLGFAGVFPPFFALSAEGFTTSRSAWEMGFGWRATNGYVSGDAMFLTLVVVLVLGAVVAALAPVRRRGALASLLIGCACVILTGVTFERVWTATDGLRAAGATFTPSLGLVLIAAGSVGAVVVALIELRRAPKE